MQPHPDFIDVYLPRSFDLGAHRLTPLAPDNVDEDFDAVMRAAPVVMGIFGVWPDGLTRASNLIDMAWHEREFTARRSFSWIIRNAAGIYQGCFYIFPKLGERGAVTATCWLIDMPDRVAVATDLKAALAAWMARNLPTGLTVDWAFRPEI